MGKLTEEQKEDIVYRLLYGETLFDIHGVMYKIIVPSPKIRVLANRIYQDTIHQNRFEKWLKDRDCLAILVRNGLCTPDIDNNLKIITQRIDDLKVDLYESLLKTDVFNKTRKELNMIRTKYQEMISIRHSFDHLTLKGYAEMVKRQFLIFKTFYKYDSNTPVWEEWEKTDSHLMDLATFCSVQHIIPSDHLREVSRTDPWRTFWNASKGKPFKTSVGNLSDEQRAIVLYAQMYDNVSKHPECPPDNIVEDDDLFDGWLLSERRKRDKERNTKQINDQLGERHKNADEIFLFTKTHDVKQAMAEGDEKKALELMKKEAEKIDNLNTAEGKIIKQQREQQIKRAGTITDDKFLDKKLQLQQQANRQFIERTNRRK